MSEMKSVPGILDVIKRITSNHETGRLEIDSSGMRGTLLFYAGKLVDARLGSLSGFQAVNAAAALRDAQVSFDHVEPASHVSTITANERLVLKRFFGIEAAEVEEPKDNVEPDWNPAPEPVVPLTQAGTIPPTFFSRPRVAAVCLALVLGLAIGAVGLRWNMKAPQVAPVASAVESQSNTVSAAQGEVKHTESQPEVKQVAADSAPVAAESRRVAAESQSGTVSQPSVTASQPRPPVTVSQQQDSPVRSDSPSPSMSAAQRPSNEREANVQDLTGEWRVINTVEKTAYKPYDTMEVGFRLTINQNGKEFTATGEKFSENGQMLPVRNRTPIRVTGSIEGDKVVATFVEDGRMRRTNGRFVWQLQSGEALAGTFVSTAAKSSGRSAVTKEQ